MIEEHPGGEEEAETAASLSGRPAVVLVIRKQSGQNAVKVVDDLKERLTEIGRTLPAGTRMKIIRDNTETTRTAVDAVRQCDAAGVRVDDDGFIAVAKRDGVLGLGVIALAAAAGVP